MCQDLTNDKKVQKNRLEMRLHLETFFFLIMFYIIFGYTINDLNFQIIFFMIF